MHRSIIYSTVVALALTVVPAINAAPVADKRLYLLPPQPTKRYFVYTDVPIDGDLTSSISASATTTEAPVKRDAMFLIDFSVEADETEAEAVATAPSMAADAAIVGSAYFV